VARAGRASFPGVSLRARRLILRNHHPAGLPSGNFFGRRGDYLRTAVPVEELAVKTSPVLVLPILAAALTLGACGDDSDGGDTPTTLSAEDDHAAEHDATGDHGEHAEETPTTLSAEDEHGAEHDATGDHADH
jgi:hypothetical protein